MQRKIKTYVLILSLLIALPLIGFQARASMRHWVILPQTMSGIGGDVPRVLYFDKNSIKYQNNKGMASVDYKASFGTPPSKVEKMYYLGTADMNCETGKITGEKLTLYVYNLPTKSLSEHNILGQYETNRPTYSFNYVYKIACKIP